jgi:hypothetical protein
MVGLMKNDKEHIKLHRKQHTMRYFIWSLSAQLGVMIGRDTTMGLEAYLIVPTALLLATIIIWLLPNKWV